MSPALAGATVGGVSGAASSTPVRALVAVSTGVVLLAGCGGGGGSETAAGSSAPATSTAAQTTAPDLASGLLTAEAFDPAATVVAVSLEQLRAGAGLAGMGDDLTVTPEECAPAVQGTQPYLDAFDDVVGLSATSPSGVTVEILLRGGPTSGAVELLASAVQVCPQAQVSSPGIGTATVTFEEVPVPDLGDGAIGLRFTTVVAAADGTEVTVPALIGVFQDGDRLGILTSLADPRTPNAPAPDAAAFAALLGEAYDVQADALG
ncbi:hypothetical protein GCM10010531_10320 [Blastococcus jejuensis]|uniref:PknH-like extracellular domain-containing protein n=1 Tax=Blastococcus jejuensis TaxID=351224 RepID=A0ABP6P2B9_9ACTN